MQVQLLFNLVNFFHMKKIILITCSILFGTGVFSQSIDDELKLVNRVYAISNATVIQKPGSTLENATVIIRDGLIEAVGTNVQIPFDAQKIKGDSLYIYPGFIDGMSKAGVKKEKSSNDSGNNSRNNQNANEPLTNKRSGITPEVSVLDQLDPKSNDFQKYRELGFTVAHVVPEGDMIPGTGSIISLDGKSREEMSIVQEASVYAQFKGTSNRVFPATTIGVMSKFRDVYHNASLAQDHMGNYESNPAGLVRPNYDQATLHMIPVVNGDLPVFFSTESVLDAHRAINLKDDLGFNLVLADLQQGWPALSIIKEKNIPVLLSLDLPDEIKENKKEEKDESTDNMEKTEKDAEKEGLEMRKKKSVEEYVAQASKFAGQNVAFGFSSFSAKTGDIKKNLKRMIAAGLSEEDALAALTTAPAEMLGLTSSLGTLDEGKMANMVVTTGPYFDEDTHVKYVFVDGNKHEYEIKKKSAKKSADPDAKPAKIDGKWSYNMDVPQQTVEGELEFLVDGEDISGSITNPQMGDGSTDLDNLNLSGNNLTFSMTIEMGGQSITIDYDLDFEPDSFSGSASVGEFGTFDIEGDKIPN